MIKEKFRVFKGKRYLHIAFFPFALLPSHEKKQKANEFNFFLPLKTLNFSLPPTAVLSKNLITSLIKICGLRPHTFIDNNDNNILVFVGKPLILNKR